MKIKNTSKFLITSLFLSNFNIFSFAGSLSDDGRYETFEDSDISIENILEDKDAPLSIEGETVLNLVDVPDVSYLTAAGYPTQVTKNIKDNYTYRWEKPSANGDIYYPKIVLSRGSRGPIEPNKTYTIQYKIRSSQDIQQGFCIANGDAYLGNGHNSVSLVNVDFSELSKEAVIKKTFTTNNPTSPINELAIGFGPMWEHTDDVVFPQWVEISDVVIVEGDWSNKDIPDFFDTSISSFEDNLVTQDMIDSGNESKENLGKYKADIKTTGKNLLNLPKREVPWDGAYINSDGNTFTFIPNENDSMGIECFGSLSYTTPLKIKKGTPVTLSGSQISGGTWDSGTMAIGLIVYFEDGSSSLFRLPDFTTSNYNQTHSNTTIFDLDVVKVSAYGIGWSVHGARASEYKYRIQLEEGSAASEYEPFREDIKTVYLNSPLLKGDTVEYINGQLYHVRRYGKTVLNGSEEWRIGISEGKYGFDEDYSLFYMPHVQIGKINMKESSINPDRIFSYSNKFKSLCRDDGWHVKYQGEYIHNECIGIKNSRLPSLNLDGFKQWLSENPVTVVYELDKYIYEPIKSELKVQLFEGTTHIYNNSTLSTNMNIVVDRTANRAKEAIEVAKTNPTIENIEIARMWSNLLKDSILKDDLQGEIDNITEITNLVVEKKKVSANLDLYVKSENALSMSLDTNSVTFENYNNTEDIEKLGAVNITVSSSLPYDLNAYMPNGISNMDGTKTMDSNLLNIRENSTSTYKPFVGIDTKINLKEDCSSGNNNLHTIDFKLNGSQSHDVDIYRTVIKFEAQQK